MQRRRRAGDGDRSVDACGREALWRKDELHDDAVHAERRVDTRRNGAAIRIRSAAVGSEAARQVC